jgi:hypothetical protein
MSMPSGHFWFCLKHHAVEPDGGTSRWQAGSSQRGTGCGPADRLGPYPTREEAEHALEKVQARNEEWDNDPNWNDAGHGSGPVGR